MRKPSVRKVVVTVASATAVVLADHYVKTYLHITTKTAYERDRNDRWTKAWRSGYESGKSGMFCMCTPNHSPLCPVKENSKI